MVDADRARKQRYLAKLDEILDSLDELRTQVQPLKNLAEGVNPGREVLTDFDEHCQRSYAAGANPPVHYEFNKTVDPAHVKRLLKTMDRPTLRARITRYFADREPFLVRNKHPFNLFISRINTYAPPTLTPPNLRGRAFDPEPAPAADCGHQPRCVDDATCTAKRRTELRNV